MIVFREFHMVASAKNVNLKKAELTCQNSVIISHSVVNTPLMVDRISFILSVLIF